MTVTREQVQDLHPGDVVEIRYDEWPDAVTRGPLRVERDGRLWVVRTAVREADGSLTWNGLLRLLTVVSRAPRPLYVNHDRTEPVAGDVVRDADSNDHRVWVKAVRGEWVGPAGEYLRGALPARLLLLVDGETGQVVP